VTGSPGAAGGGRHGWGPIAVVLGATALFGSVSLIYPFGRDQGIYAFLAQSVLQGKVVYRDIAMTMAPLTVFVHALAILLFGSSMTSIRILDLLWTMATAVLLFVFVRQALNRRWVAATAAVIFSLLYYLFNYWYTAQVDGFLNLPVVAALAVVLPGLKQPGQTGPLRWLAAGVLLGLAVFFKYPAALLLAAIVAFSLCTGLRAGRGRSGFAWILAGFGIVVALFAAALAAYGALGAFVEPIPKRAFSYPTLDYLHEGALGRLGRMVKTYFSRPDYYFGALLGVAGLGVSVAAFRKRGFAGVTPGRLTIVLLWMWFLTALLSVYLQGRLFFYHYLPLLPVFAVFGSLALAALMGLFRKRRAWQVLLMGAVGVALLACTAYPGRFLDLARVVTGATTLQDYWSDSRHSTPDFLLAEQLVLASYVRAHTEPDEHVLVWGLDPLVNFVAGRPSATRFVYNHLLTAEWSWPGLRQEFIQELAADTPAVIVVAHRDALPWVTGHGLDSYGSLLEFPEFREFVAENYELEHRVGRFELLRRAGSDYVLPSTGLSRARLEDDLLDALRFAEKMDTAAYRAMFWTWSPDSPPAGRAREDVRRKLISYRAVIRSLWLGEEDTDDLFPALSVWVRADSRPFASVSPFCYQSDGEHFIAGGFRFTLLHTTGDSAVMLYSVEAENSE